MATKRSEQQSSRLNSPKISSSRFLYPEFSEDPRFSSVNTVDTKGNYEKSHLNPLELRTSNDLSIQASTQHSLSFKNSFSTFTPQKSLKHLDFSKLSHSRADSMKYSLRLEDKAKDSEDFSLLKNSEFIKLDEESNVLPNAGINEPIIFEGQDDLKIPTLRWCAHCRGEVMTKISYVNNEKTFWSAVGIFLSGGVFGCFLLPYLSNSCKGVKVKCSKCDRMLC